jgi:hypothetical protein
MTHDDRNTPLRRAMQDYNSPPALSSADLDEMWSAVEARAFEPGSDVTPGSPLVDSDFPGQGAPRRFNARAALALAATLVLGVAIGRLSVRQSQPLAPAVIAQVLDSLKLPEPYQSTTSRYLGQTAALLATLPSEVRSGRADERFTGRARDLLLTTRLLLDSPAASDPRIRTLLDDLELVLAQIVRLQTDQSGEELDLIRQALEQRDVLPRLRTAVADISADD